MLSITLTPAHYFVTLAYLDALWAGDKGVSLLPTQYPTRKVAQMAGLTKAEAWPRQALTLRKAA